MTTTESSPTPEPIHVLMQRVHDEMPAVGKHHEAPASMGGYAFRGIEDVLRELNPLLAKHALFYVPHVLDRVRADRQTRNGGMMYETSLHVVLRFHGPAGDSLEMDAWGEAVDSGDKSTPKAVTNAVKNAVLAWLALPTEETANSDTDRSEVEPSVAPPQSQGPRPDIRQLTARVETLDPLVAEAFAAWKQDQGFPWPWPSEAVVLMNRHLDWLTTPDGPSPTAPDDLGPCVICGHTNTKRASVDGVVRCQRVSDCTKRAEKAAAEATGGDTTPAAPDEASSDPPPEARADEQVPVRCIDCDAVLGEHELAALPENAPRQCSEHSAFL